MNRRGLVSACNRPRWCDGNTISADTARLKPGFDRGGDYAAANPHSGSQVCLGASPLLAARGDFARIIQVDERSTCAATVDHLLGHQVTSAIVY
jgi:hypothetical protein